MSNSTISDQSLMDKSMRSVFGKKHCLILDYFLLIMIPPNLQICMIFLNSREYPVRSHRGEFKGYF